MHRIIEVYQIISSDMLCNSIIKAEIYFQHTTSSNPEIISPGVILLSLSLVPDFKLLIFKKDRESANDISCYSIWSFTE